jgi:hypothetical protein
MNQESQPLSPPFSLDPHLQMQSGPTGELYRAAHLGQVLATRRVAELSQSGEGVGIDPFEAFNWYLKAADLGDPVAQREVGRLYELGRGTRKDAGRAALWYLAAAEAGDSEAMRLMGNILRHDPLATRNASQEWYKKAIAAESVEARVDLANLLLESFNPSTDEGLFLLQEAADKGSWRAHLRLAEWHRRNRSKNVEEPQRWYRSSADLMRVAAAKGDAEAQFQLGHLFLAGHGTSKNPAEALRWLLRSGDQCHPGAQALLGSVFETGVGVQVDLKEAATWYQKAAEAGLEEAQVRLGQLYAEGRGVAQDGKLALLWFGKAWRAGNAEAARRIAEAHLFDAIGVQDSEVALEYYRHAAELGDEEAQWYLVDAYRWGEGAERNRSEAIHWLKVLGEEGNDADALMELSRMYEGGEGIKPNEAKALEYLHSAAEGGCIEAQALLGLQLQCGRGLPQDNEDAYFWLSLAGSRGEDVEPQLGLCKAQLAPEVIQQLDERIADRLAHQPKEGSCSN